MVVRAGVQNATASRGQACRFVGTLVLILILAGSLRDAAGAGERTGGLSGGPVLARRIRVPLPLVGSQDLLVKQAIQQVLAEVDVPQAATDTPTSDRAPSPDRRPALVLEFWASPQRADQAAGSEFERSLALARYLTSGELRRVRTVAYLPQTVTGHAVLAAMACEELIMAPDAVLGDAGARESSIGPTMRGGYTEIARSRRTLPEAVALGMLDRELTVSRVISGQGATYAWNEELDRLRSERNDLQTVETIQRAGETGRYRGDRLRAWGIVSHLAANISDVARRLEVPEQSLELDPSLGAPWKALHIPMEGPITTRVVNRIQRTLQQEVDRQQVNFACFEIATGGGEPAEVARLANFIAALDPSRVRTVAYLPRTATPDCLLIALACDYLVIGNAVEVGARGDFVATPQQIADLRAVARAVAAMKRRPWSLVAALIDPSIVVHRYTQGSSGQDWYLCDEELRERGGVAGLQPAAAGLQPAAAGDWSRGETIADGRAPLTLTARRAVELGLARNSVDSLAQLAEQHQLSMPLPQLPSNWALDLIEGLASPQLSGLLLFIGGMALIAELSAPGVGVGGFISFVCFLLYFWSNYMQGTADVLEMMLFVAGLGCLLIELLVLPGFGLFGLFGGGMVLAALVLASQTFVFPRTEFELAATARTLAVVVGTGVAMLGSLAFLQRHLHRLPGFSRLTLEPPTDADLQEQRELLVDYRDLLHQEGTACTPMRPSGKAEFGERMVDVLSDGEAIEIGTRVRVVEVAGNRVLVQAVRP